LKDYYSILNVSPSASVSEIKRSFRQLALKYHPDKNPDPSAGTIFQEINEAYDVLSDSAKRQLYDQRLQNPFAEILTETPQTKRHRDPAYRRNPRPRPTGPTIPESVQLMIQYFKYVRWMSWVGLIFSSIIFLDYFLPYKIEREKIVNESSVRDRRGGLAYVRMHTASGRKLKIYPEQFVQLAKADDYTVAYTLIFSSRMWIAETDNNDSVSLAYIYHSQILFVIALFVTSALAALFRQNIEFSFNSSIVSGVMTIVVWFFL
jgi:curved DNA-binding protein CbpA